MVSVKWAWNVKDQSQAGVCGKLIIHQHKELIGYRHSFQYAPASVELKNLLKRNFKK